MVQEVVAVDPAALDAEVAALPSLRHLQMKIEQAVPKLQEERAVFDLLTCDINSHPKAVCGHNL